MRRHLGSKDRKRVYAASAAGGAAAADATVDEPTTEDERGRFCLSDADVTQLAQYARVIENHYTRLAGTRAPPHAPALHARASHIAAPHPGRVRARRAAPHGHRMGQGATLKLRGGG